jgi:hypothetical protein
VCIVLKRVPRCYLPFLAPRKLQEFSSSHVSLATPPSDPLREFKMRYVTRILISVMLFPGNLFHRNFHEHSWFIQEISKLFWKPKVTYHVHKGLPVALVLRFINPMHALNHVFVRYILMLCFRLHLDLVCFVFPSDIQTKSWVHFSCSTCNLHDPPISLSLM